MIDPGKIAVGTVVRLVSGGPKMTVESRISETKVNCVWFGGDYSQLRQADFKVALLVEAPYERS